MGALRSSHADTWIRCVFYKSTVICLSVLTCIDSRVCCSSLVAGSLRFSYCRQGQIYGISGFCLPGCHVRMCTMHKLAVGIHAPVVGLGAVSACFMCTCASVWFASRLARGDFRCASHDVAAFKTWWKIRSSSTCGHVPNYPPCPLLRNNRPGACNQ